MTKTVKENIRIRYRLGSNENVDEGQKLVCKPRGKTPYFRSKQHGNILLTADPDDGVLTGVVQLMQPVAVKATSVSELLESIRAKANNGPVKIIGNF